MAMAMNTKILRDEASLRIWLRISNNATTQRKHNARIMALCKRCDKLAPTVIMVAPAYHPHHFDASLG